MYLRRSIGVGVGILLTLGACTDTTGPGRLLEVSITTSSAIVTVHQPVIITVAAVNKGEEPVDVHANSFPEAYRVTTSSGELVAPGPALCTALGITKVLQPGERLEFSYSWGGTTRERIEGPTVQLPAALYQLRGVVFAGGEEIRSAAIPIEVQP